MTKNHRPQFDPFAAGEHNGDSTMWPDELDVAPPPGAADSPRRNAGYISRPEQFEDLPVGDPRHARFELETVEFDGTSDSSSQHEIQRSGSTVQRHRWGTQRHRDGRPHRQRSTLGRLSSKYLHHHHHQQQHNGAPSRSASKAGKRGHNAEAAEDEDPREIYLNMPLPVSLKNPATGLPNTEYCRNKIRTTKYKPLNFLPKNLWYQLHNIANLYFIFIVILGFFPIFGVPSPGLTLVPIVVIICITAIKDAIEDYRRTLLDLEVNNTLSEVLVNNPNPNVVVENVSYWRRFKKANSRLIMKIGRWIYSKRAARKERKTGKAPVASTIFKDTQQLGGDVASIYSRESIGLMDMNPVDNNPFGDPTSDNIDESVVNPRAHPATKANFRIDYWKNMRVGDFARIRNDEEIPADMVVLSTSEEDGACYVETKNLDGETNLKIRQALRCGRDIRHSADCQKAQFWIDCEAPQANLYAFNGVAKWYRDDVTHSEPITINNVLLRGCKLRNTSWVIGVIIYTGGDTKIMMNAGATPTKRSRLQKDMNKYVFYNFILLFFLCLASGLVNGIKNHQDSTFIRIFDQGSAGGSPPVDGIVTFWAALILYQSLVPVSLYISIEIVKTIQAFFIFSDVHMYYEKIDYPPTPKSWNISDDLGQIEYVFSDKTGTLTQNVMEFKKCTINGVTYGKAYTEALAGLRKRQGVDVEKENREMEEEIAEDKVKMVAQLKEIDPNNQTVTEEMTFVSNEFVSDLRGASGLEQAKADHHFMLALALCNSVITEPSKQHPGRTEFKAQSPDEAALVAGARDVGFALVGRVRRGLIVNVQGKEVEYQILNTLEFNSTRKRMSAIVQLEDPETKSKRILLICKGADSVIYERLAPGVQKELREKTAVQLESFANEGFRTLCIAERELTPKQYNEWNERHAQAAAEIHDREEKLEVVADSIERDLTLLGGTAIEDRLQDGVPTTISLLADGGVKLWVLTGDKVETAINIGFSCNLLDSSMELLIIKVENDDKSSVPAMIDEMLRKHFNMEGSHDELERARSDHSVPDAKYALVIDGDALKLALNPAIQHKFLLLCKQCRSVLCCRVSPAQKAAVVRMVRRNLDVMTLSIGDGANDVAMIQEADVGVGIAGEEGRQAVMSSDYAIGQFRFLSRLMLVHGRWSYKRLAEMIPNFFYKNIVFTMTLFWYGVFNNFDCTYLYEYTFVMFFNLAFTSLPIILLGVLDQDLPDRVSLAVPQLYRRGILRADFNETKFWLYLIEGIYQSFIAFFFPYFCYSPGNFQSMTGRALDHRYWMGLPACVIAVMSCNLYVLMNQYRWDWLSLLINIISSLLVLVWSGIYSSTVFSQELYKQAAEMLGSLMFWAVSLLGIVASLMSHFAIISARAFWRPYDTDIIREQWGLGEFDKVLATPRAANDPDAAKYENPYRKDGYHAPSTPGRSSWKHSPYELKNDSHASFGRSPDYIKVGNKTFESENFQWKSSAKEIARDAVPERVRKSLDHARRHSRYEQGPANEGIADILTTTEVHDLTTAEGLMKKTNYE